MWNGIVIVLLLGYFCMGRSFAYLGIPPWHVFIGEVVLGCFLLLGPRTVRGRWPWVATKIPRLHNLVRAFLLFLLYGVFQMLHGIYGGNPPLTAFRDLAFNYYPLYFFLGLWVGLRNPEFLPRFIRLLAWFNGLYGLLFILLLNRADWFIVGVSQNVEPVPVFGQPGYSAVALLGLLAFENDLRRVLHLLVMNSFVLLVMQIRAEWLAFLLGILVLGWATKRFRRLAAGGAVVLLLFGLLYIADVSVPLPESRGGGVISAKDLVGRAIVPLNPSLAAQYTEHFQSYEETAVWRTIWWAAIWQSVHKDTARALLGFGFGFPLGDFVPYLEGKFIQTPHNFFFYALGYTGWIGVVLFCLFQAELFRLLWKTHRQTGQAFGVALWAAIMSLATFTAIFEVPYGAIPFYLLIGLMVASLFFRQRVETNRAWAEAKNSGSAFWGVRAAYSRPLPPKPRVGRLLAGDLRGEN